MRDLAPLAKLGELDTLDLDDCWEVCDVTLLEKLPGCRRLFVRGCEGVPPEQLERLARRAGLTVIRRSVAPDQEDIK